LFRCEDWYFSKTGEKWRIGVDCPYGPVRPDHGNNNVYLQCTWQLHKATWLNAMGILHGREFIPLAGEFSGAKFQDLKQ
jgi:hypothetical protein